MRKPGAVDVLRNLGWLASTPVGFRDALAMRADVVQLRRGQQVYDTGDDTGGIFGVATGRLEVHLTAGIDAPTLTHLLLPGDWFGEIAAMSGSKRQVSILARVETRALRLPRAEMVRMMHEDSSAGVHFSRLGTDNYVKAIGLIAMLRRDDAVGRIAALLLLLLRPDGDGATRIAVSQGDLGAMSRLGRTTVNDALSRLEASGLIERGYSAVTVIDRDGLAQVESDGAG